MKYCWCITKDWESPAEGERWHRAKSEKSASDAAMRYIRQSTHHYVGGYVRSVMKGNGDTIVDFGNHIWFVLIKKEAN